MEADANKGPLQVGGKLLKYTIRGLLGRGGYAWVYEGYDEFLDVEVAIKVLHRAGGVTADMLRRGQAEAKFLYRLRHDNVVEVLDAGLAETGLYIVMELLRGPTLRTRLQKEGPMPLGDALPFFAQVCDGIGSAHAIKAVHRDIKPENLVIEADNRAKVLDFGIVKVLDAVGGTTERDVVHGTVLYLSPEQLNGITATPRSDVYALGLTIFESLYGKHPLLLRNEHPTQAELPWIQLTLTPPRLDKLDGRIPKDVARLIERMLVKDPALRAASMQECAAELRACASRLTSSGLEHVSITTDSAVRALTAPESQRDTVRDGDAFDRAVTLKHTPEPSITSGGTERIELKRLLPNIPVATIERPGDSARPPAVVALPARSVPSPKPATAKPRPRVSSPAASVHPGTTPGTVPPVTTAGQRLSSPVLETAPPQLVLKWVAICALAGAAIGGVVLFLTPVHSTKPERPATSSPVAPLAQPVAATSAEVPAPASASAVVAPAAPVASAPTPAAKRTTRTVASSAPDSAPKAKNAKAPDKMQDRLRWVEQDLDKEKKAKPTNPPLTNPAAADILQ
jgi:serine/threonine protein kinase